jgi:hypothetical protein
MRMIPTSFNHRFSLYLFAGRITYRARSGTSKKAFIAVTLAGLVFLRPQSASASHGKNQKNAWFQPKA